MELSYTPEPTVHPDINFDAAQDGVALREAMKGFGTNEDVIIEILTKRSNAQRQKIAKFFTEEYGRNLIEDLKSELGGKFEDLIVALMLPPVEYLCKQLHKAMKGIGTNESCLVEILCTHDNKEIQEIVEAYERMYDRPLAEHMCSETSGDFRRLLTLIITGVRKDPSAVDPEAAKELAEKLHAAGNVVVMKVLTGDRRTVKEGQQPDRERAVAAAEELVSAGEGKWGTDEEVFNKILAHESFPQLRLIFEEYKNLAGRTIEQGIKNELSGELKEAALAIVECVQCPPTFFARRLHHAMAGAGTDDTTLIRIVVSRSEIDLGNIKSEYERMYDKTLESAMRGETHGHYKKALLALIN